MGVRISPGVPIKLKKNLNTMSFANELFCKLVSELVKNEPNDMELGKHVRMLYYSTQQEEKSEPTQSNVNEENG
jgi:hypothetical protein